MSNTVYITTRKKLDEAALEIVMNKLLAEHFDGKIFLSKEGDSWWEFRDSENSKLLWDGGIFSVKKFESSWPNKDYVCWLWLEFIEVLGEKLLGRVSDSGVSGSWKPSVGKFPTYESYLDNSFPKLKENKPEVFKITVESLMEDVPSWAKELNFRASMNKVKRIGDINEK